MVKNVNGKKMLINKEERMTRHMLSVIRESKNNNSQKNTIITEDAQPIVINKNTKIFGEVGETMKENLIQTVGEEIVFEENALIYNPAENALTLSGKIKALNTDFQFKPAGCTVRIDGLTLTDDTYQKIGKLLNGFKNWRENQASDGDLLNKLQRLAQNE